MNIPTTPDGMPTLAAGAHFPGEGKACTMEMVAYLNGESWTDHPKCTNPLLASMARLVNDILADDVRSELMVPLIVRLFGTTDDSMLVQRAMLEAVDLPCESFIIPTFVVRSLATRYRFECLMGLHPRGNEAYSLFMHDRLVKMLDAYEIATGRVKAVTVHPVLV